MNDTIGIDRRATPFDIQHAHSQISEIADRWITVFNQRTQNWFSICIAVNQFRAVKFVEGDWSRSMGPILPEQLAQPFEVPFLTAPEEHGCSKTDALFFGIARTNGGGS